MQRRFRCRPAFLALVFTVLSTLPAAAIDEPERLWLVGERAFADGLYPVARRALERFVDRYPSDSRAPEALLLLGKSRLTLGEIEPALDAFRRASAATPRPGQGSETRFWEGEALFRLKRYAEARTAYEEVIRGDASSKFAPDALYGYGWTELELKRPEPAVTAFRDFLQTWKDHSLAPSATYQLARALVDLKRYGEAVPILSGFATKYPNDRRTADVEYLLGWARLQSGDVTTGLANMRTFVANHPNHPQAAEARRLIGQTLTTTGNRGALQTEYASLMSLSPPTPDALVEAMTIARRLQRPTDEAAAWNKLKADFPKHPLTVKTAGELADAAFKKKDWKQTITYAQAATAATEDTPRAEAWLLIGESELKLKRYPNAAKAFEEVGTIEGGDVGTRYRALAGLGIVREEQKNWSAALTAYEAVGARSPDTALKQWARERAEFVKSQIKKPAASPPKSAPAPSKPKGSS